MGYTTNVIKHKCMVNAQSIKAAVESPVVTTCMVGQASRIPLPQCAKALIERGFWKFAQGNGVFHELLMVQNHEIGILYSTR